MPFLNLIKMDFYFIHDGPLWISIIILLLGLVVLGIGIIFLKSGRTCGAWFLAIAGIDFKKEERPILYWFFTLFWLFWGLLITAIGLIMII